MSMRVEVSRPRLFMNLRIEISGGYFRMASPPDQACWKLACAKSRQH